MTTFTAAVHQNAYLPRGTSAVHAIVTVAASGEAGAALDGGVPAQVLLLDCSGSMANPWTKMEAARTATCRAIDRLPDGTWFAIVAGTAHARLVYPSPPAPPGTQPTPAMALASAATREAAKAAVERLGAGGGTAISQWLGLARELFETRPGGINHALLLTDGRDEGEERSVLTSELERCLGAFQCDCRGFGTDWDPVELQTVSDALLGTTDIIAHPSQMDAEFEAIVQRSMRKRVGSVQLQLLTPIGSGVRFFKQVAPEVLDLTDRVMWQQPAGLDNRWQMVKTIDPGRPLLSTYPTGAWAGGEEREYHVCLGIVPQEVGQHHEVRAGRLSLVADGRAMAHAAVTASWTDEPERTTRIDRAVAHYTGQEELARSIDEGLQARRQGDVGTAIARLGRAAHLASASGNEQTTRLLLRVVEIQDAERGTVRLKSDVSKEDEMTLDTRSRRTVRLGRAQEP